MPHQFSNQEYADIIFVYGFCDGNGRAASREYELRFPGRRCPNHQTFSNVFSFVREKGHFPTQNNIDQPVRHPVQQEEDILNLIEENPKTSTRKIARRLHITQKITHSTIKNEGLYPYHIQEVQRLEPGDYANRLVFCQWIRRHQRDIHRTLWTDEAQFTRDGVNNSRNCHLWSLENPNAIRQSHSQHRFSINVWAGIINRKLIGPHIFEERLDGNQYLHFLENILPNLLQNENVNLRGMYFQHDGAPPHYARIVSEFLNNRYPNRWIGRGGPHYWPARSPDFNPLDFFFWGYMKNLVYEEEINTRDQLLQRIITSFQEIKNRPGVIRSAVSNLNIRGRKCEEVNGGHFENILK